MSLSQLRAFPSQQCFLWIERRKIGLTASPGHSTGTIGNDRKPLMTPKPPKITKVSLFSMSRIEKYDQRIAAFSNKSPFALLCLPHEIAHFREVQPQTIL